MALNIPQMLRGLLKTGEETATVARAGSAITRSVEGAGSLSAHMGEGSFLRRIGLEVHHLDTPQGKPLRVAFIGPKMAHEARESVLGHIRTLIDDAPEALEGLKKVQILTDPSPDSSVAQVLRGLYIDSAPGKPESYGRFRSRTRKIQINTPLLRDKFNKYQWSRFDLSAVTPDHPIYVESKKLLHRAAQHSTTSRSLVNSPSFEESIRRTLTHEWGHALHYGTSGMKGHLPGMDLSTLEEFSPRGFSDYATDKYRELFPKYERKAQSILNSTTDQQMLTSRGLESIIELMNQQRAEPQAEIVAELFAAAHHEPQRISPEVFRSLNQTLRGSSKKVARLTPRRPRVPGGRSTLRRMGIPGA